ncbi:MAG: CdaR family protein [Thermomicrobiales bacterium]
MADLSARIFTKANLIRMIISLILALILWGWINTIEDPRRGRTFDNLTVTSQNLSSDLVLTTTVPNASVHLEGPQSAVLPLTPSRIVPLIDLSNVTEPGVYTVPIETAEIDEIWTVDVTPSEIQLTVERRVSKKMALQTEIAGEIGSNRQINSITASVSEVTVEGSETAVNLVASVGLPVTVGTQTRTFTENFSPVARDADGAIVDDVVIDPGTVSVTVDISQRGKEVAVVPQFAGLPASGYRVTGQVSNPLTVIVDGPSDWLADVVAVQTEPIDITGATESVRQTVAIVDLPPGASVITPSDGQVNVQISIVADGVRQEFLGLQVVATNAGAFNVLIEPSQIDVTLFGTASALAQLTSSDILVRVDVTGLGPGVYQLTPEVSLPQGVTWVASNPTVVSVTITGPAASGSTPEGTPSSP